MHVTDCGAAVVPSIDHSDAAISKALLMQSRQTILPKRLFAPGPDPHKIGMLFNAATAPDHGQLLP